MMISEPYLDGIRARREAVRDIAIEIASGSDGHAKLLARRGVGQVELRVTRDGDPASDGDVLFVGHAFSDIPRLLAALESDSQLTAGDAAGISLRLASASPGPWTAFIESDGGLGGPDVIRVSESDNEADMYLWMGPDLAPSAIFRFVAEARQDVPALLAATRQQQIEDDAAVTFREVTSSEILAALGDGGKDSVLRACVAALRAHPRPSYAIGGSPANGLRESLEVKYRHAATRGKTLIGDYELLLRLQELGSEPVAVVSAHHAGKSFYVYVTPSTLKPVGAVIMYDTRGEESFTLGTQVLLANGKAVPISQLAAPTQVSERRQS